MPAKAVWIGEVERDPTDGDGEPDGLLYMRCGRCKRHQVYKIVPLEAA